jgi:adenylylsulfate kinase
MGVVKAARLLIFIAPIPPISPMLPIPFTHSSMDVILSLVLNERRIMTEQMKSTNITWHKGNITREDRERLNGHKAVVLWFTGLSGSGKSTIAHAVEDALFERGCRSFVLDGDNIRHGLNKNLGFSPEDRAENIRRIGEVANLFANAGIVAMTAFISPYREDRDKARQIAGEGNFIEVYVKCAIDVCEQRDTKGLYKKARAGEVKEFTGISAPYEEPLDPELIVDTGKETLEESAQKVMDVLKARGIIA